MFNGISLKSINSKYLNPFIEVWMENKFGRVYECEECYVQVFRINRGFSINLFRSNKRTTDKYSFAAKSEIMQSLFHNYVRDFQGFAKDYLIRKSHLPLFLCLEPKHPELTWRYAEASAFPRTESIFTFYKN